MSSTVVIQAKQGIGDVMWHLPFIRAIAAASPGGAVTFLSLPSSHAKELLEAESCVDRTLYYENRGSELARGIHVVRLIRLLRQLRCETAWILDRTVRPAMCATAAGVANRIGLGFGLQRLFITNAGIDRGLRHAHPIEWLNALMAAADIPFPTTEPNLRLPPMVIETIGRRYREMPRPWIVLSMGSNHPYNDWPMRSWVEFTFALRRRTAGTVFVIGGPANAGRAQEVVDRTAGASAVNACNLAIVEAAALLHHADLFVGPDSGPMNLAAAVGTPAFGLFGASRVLTYSRFIQPIVPDGGPATSDGMQRIPAAKVLERISPYLSAP